MIPITVNYTATDNCSVGCVLTVTSNEAVNGLGDGDTAPDWQVLDAHHILLRSERSGKGNGRIYTITVTCTDPAGNRVVRTTTVVVPKSQAKVSTSVDLPTPLAITPSAATTPNVAAPISATSGGRGSVVYIPLLNVDSARGGTTAQNKANRRATIRKKKRTRNVSARE